MVREEGEVKGTEDGELVRGELSWEGDEAVVEGAQVEHGDEEVTDESLGSGSTGRAFGEAIDALEQVEGHESEELDEDERFDT